MNQDNFPPYSVGKWSDRADPFARGLDYLHHVRTLALEPDIVNMFDRSTDASADRQRQYTAIYTWIGLHINTVNAELNACLNACQECFQLGERPAVQIFAAPLTPSYGIDGVCNLRTNPITILVDTGRVDSKDWLGLVAHEYTHAYVGSPGHQHSFFTVLSHLCLGLGFEPPPWKSGSEQQLRSWPPGRPLPNSVSFWLGQNWPCPLHVTDYYSQLEKAI